jgi:hypothetical protein
MDDNVKLIESMLESIFKYGLSELELIRLKALNKTSDVVTGLVPHAIFRKEHYFLAGQTKSPENFWT